MAKKILIGLALIIAVAAGGVFYLVSNLDELVRTAIQDYGSEALGTQVTVGGVDISLRDGAVTIYDFSIANPEGFSDKDLMSFSQLSIALDLDNISRVSVGVTRITTTDPFVSYERANGTTNLDVVTQRLSSGAPEEPETAGTESDMQLQIDAIEIRNIQASVSDSRLPQAVDISLGDIILQNLSGTPAEITQQILRPVMTQLASNAGQVLTSVLRDQVDTVQNQANEAVESAEDTLENVGDTVREGLGNLFGN